MPWKETCAVEERERFIRLWLSGRYSKIALCEQFGISRPTDDKWIKRHAEFGMVGLLDWSRAPKVHPNAIDALTCERLVQAKLSHPSWGPKKLLDLLRQRHLGQRWPADSTGGEILKRAGLVKPKRERRTVAADGQPFAHCDAVNTVWSVDFKGDFKLGDGKRCYPLTISDNYSRYLLACQGVPRPSGRMVWPWFDLAFREYGLPYSIRSDNGTPFASKALGGLSALSKWWIDLGIRPERIEPGRPDQNGRHERMHRSLKAWLGKASGNLVAQQERMDVFRQEYNEERSHEALDRKTPAMVHRRSQREYPRTVKSAEYGSGMTVRCVRSSGEIKWRGQLLYVSEVLAGEPIGLEPCGDGMWNLYYRFHSLGQLDDRRKKIVPATRWHGK